MDPFVEALKAVLPEDWDIDSPEYGSSCLLVCPHGELVEQDGRCPEGCVSPLVTGGLI